MLDGNGNTFKTTITHIKDLVAFIRKIIAGRRIRRPKVVFSCDYGCEKLIWTMAIYDLDGDPVGFKPHSKDNIFVCAILYKVLDYFKVTDKLLIDY